MTSDTMFIRARGIVQGPFTREQLQVLLRRGQFSRIHEVSPDGNTWSRASVLTDLFVPTGPAAVKATPPVAVVPESEVELVDEVHVEESPEVADCYVARNNVEHGPYLQRELLDWARQGELAPDELVWMPHLSNWTPAGQVPELCQAYGRSAGGAAHGHASQSSTRDASAGRSSTYAYASLILGILGWIILPFVGSLAAVLLGHLGLGEIRRASGSLSGQGAAVAGLILGYSGLAVALIVTAVILAMLSFN